MNIVSPRQRILHFQMCSINWNQEEKELELYS